MFVFFGFFYIAVYFNVGFRRSRRKRKIEEARRRTTTVVRRTRRKKKSKSRGRIEEEFTISSNSDSPSFLCPPQLAKVEWQVTPKHAYTLDTTKSEWADYAVRA